MVEVKDLKKVFKLSKKQMRQDRSKVSKKVAVNGISFKAQPGEIFGLLGPNGAGKTTTLRCIATLIAATEGEVSVKGLKDPKIIRENIAFLTNELKLDEHFTANDTITYFGELYNMSRQAIKERREVLFQQFGIGDFADRKIAEFSTGMKQKLSICVSLIHDPDIIIFDEPTNGLDIITAKAVVNYLLDLRALGKTIIISTHIMTVAEKLCDRLCVIIDGNIVAEGSLEVILEKTGACNLEDGFFKLYDEVVYG